MSHHLAQQAIAAAIAGNWEGAQALNKTLLNDDPEDLEALNRLAKAYGEVGKIKEALATSKKVLTLDTENRIAIKAVAKWKAIQKLPNSSAPSTPSTLLRTSSLRAAPGKQNSEMFLEEPGKTKIIPLINLGDKKIISLLDAGDSVEIRVSGRRVNLHTPDDKYLGRLPDDLAAHLKKLIELGNQYEAFVKTTDTNEVRVFLRETFRSPKTKREASFPKSAPQSFPPE